MSTGQGLYHPAYRPDIDGLRAFAVLAVLLHHGFPHEVRGGYLGVDVFFVISGYLISAILFRRLEQERFSIAEFYRRRINRIFPALLLVMAATWAAGYTVLFADEFAALGKHLLGGAGFVANLVLWSEAGYFQISSQSKPLLHLWSLGIEEQFYIFWPLLLWATWRRHHGFLLATLLLALLSFGWNLWQIAQHANTAAFYSPLTRFWELMAGGMLAWLEQHPGHLPRIPRLPRLLMSLLGLACLAAGLCTLNETLPYPGAYALWPVAGAVLLIAAGPGNPVNRYLLGNRLLVGIGLVSYPLYLWHWPLLAYVRIIEGTEPVWLLRLAALLLSVPLAVATWWLLEQPLRRRQDQAPRRAWKLAALMLVAALAGLMTWKMHGLAWRHANRHEAMRGEVAPAGVNAQRVRSRCRQWLPDLSPVEVICFMRDDAPEWLILGDSHAISLQAALQKHWVDASMMVISSNGCLPFTGFLIRIDKDIPGARDCIHLAPEALRALAHLPSVKGVLLVTRGPVYFSGQDFDRRPGTDLPIHRLSDRQPLAGTEAEDAFVQGYQQLARQLLASGRRVVMMTEWPELNFDPSLCVPRTLGPWQRPPARCEVDRSKVDARQARYRMLLERIRTAAPGVELYDPLPLFCDDSRCSAIQHGVLYYMDDDHLSSSGSRAVLLDFLRYSDAGVESRSDSKYHRPNK